MCLFQHTSLVCMCVYFSTHLWCLCVFISAQRSLVFMCVYFNTCFGCLCVFISAQKSLMSVCPYFSTHVFGVYMPLSFTVRSDRMCCVCKQAKTYFITQVFGVCVSFTVQAGAGGHWRGGGPCNGLWQNRFCVSEATGKGVPVTCQALLKCRQTFRSGGSF